FGPRTGTLAPELISICLAEFPAPLADGLIGHEDAPDEEQLFHVPIAETEVVVQPHPMADDLGGEPMIFVARPRGWKRHALSPFLAVYSMDHLAYNTGVIMP